MNLQIEVLANTYIRTYVRTYVCIYIVYLSNENSMCVTEPLACYVRMLECTYHHYVV